MANPYVRFLSVFIFIAACGMFIAAAHGQVWGTVEFGRSALKSLSIGGLFGIIFTIASRDDYRLFR